MEKVFIISYARTPIGSFNGKLSSLSATQLGATAIREAIVRSQVDVANIQEVIMGNVVSANLGQAPARQAALLAGLPTGVVCTTVNKVCASGMKAVMIGAQSIMAGMNDCVVAGGMESMSNIPFYLDKARTGYKLGHAQLIDGIIKDGLWDVYQDYHMGNAAEHTAKEMYINRQMQDDYAIESYKRSANAWASGKFEFEIVPVEVKLKGKESIMITHDEEYTLVNFEKIPSLKPVFAKEGTITAANASTLNDGAAALVIASEKFIRKHGITPLAEIVGFADAAQDPEWFTTSPSLAIPKVLAQSNLTIGDIDFFEINEAFSVVSIANNMKLNLHPEQVNIFGGAVSLGHPLGASGARILCTLMSVLTDTKKLTGIAAICNGGGGASAMIIKKIN